MKIVITGKQGEGKTRLAEKISRWIRREGLGKTMTFDEPGPCKRAANHVAKLNKLGYKNFIYIRTEAQ